MSRRSPTLALPNARLGLAAAPLAPAPAPPGDGDHIQRIETRSAFDALFQQGASVTAGAPSELKFLVDRARHETWFIPPKYAFHYDFYHEVLGGALSVADFDERAYNRPDRDWIAGTITAYDSFVDPGTGRRGLLCCSLWPTDRVDVALLVETLGGVRGGLAFLQAGEELAFRPGGPIQERLVSELADGLRQAGVQVRNNLEISAGLRYIALSRGVAYGRLVLVEGGALPRLTRADVALFLGDLPPTAPPLAGVVTTRVQTYNSHLGIKYRQDDTPYYYKAYVEAEIAALRALAGKPVRVEASASDGSISAASEAEARAWLERVRPQGRVRLSPNLDEDRVRPQAELAARSLEEGRWSRAALAAYGRKALGVVQLAELARVGALDLAEGDEPRVVAPVAPFGVPASFYAQFMKTAVDNDGDRFTDRVRGLVADPRWADPEWKGRKLEKLREAMEKAELPLDLRQRLHEQLVRPFLAARPAAVAARLRSSAPVVEDSGGSGVKLPNMAGAFDSHTARWMVGVHQGETLKRATDAMAQAIQKVWASVWNERAIAELEWHNVDLDEGSVTMAVLVMPNEDGEKANGVLRVNQDLAGFFSITGETQYGEELVTNPTNGATPDTWIDGNYDVLDGVERQDIEYERTSSLLPIDPARPHAMTDAEIHVAYKAMRVVRAHFAGLEGRAPEDYVDECEIKVLADGTVQLKQERPWVE